MQVEPQHVNGQVDLPNRHQLVHQGDQLIRIKEVFFRPAVFEPLVTVIGCLDTAFDQRLVDGDHPGNGAHLWWHIQHGVKRCSNGAAAR